MPYWTKKNYPLLAWYLTANLSATVLAFVLTPAVMACEPTELAGKITKSAKNLLPYTATYSSSFSGIDAEMLRTLEQTSDNNWQLRNFASVLFVKVEEKALFSLEQSRLTPLNYWYKNSLSSKRNSELQFDSPAATVADKLHGNKPLAIPPDSFDKLSYQPRLRLDLLNNSGQLTTHEYHLVDRSKYKTYQVAMLDSEQIEVPAGRFNAVKIKAFRQGKDDHTVIWLAADWDYFILRIQRIEQGDVEFQVELNKATIDGQTIHGL